MLLDCIVIINESKYDLNTFDNCTSNCYYCLVNVLQRVVRLQHGWARKPHCYKDGLASLRPASIWGWWLMYMQIAFLNEEHMRVS